MDNDGVCKRFILVDDEYKLFFDHRLRGDNTFLPPFDDDNGESETRNLGFEFSSGDSKLGGGGGTEKKKPPIKSRVSQKRKRETTIRESIQRDNRAAERRKRKMAELESARVSGNQVNVQGDNNKARKMSESTKVNNTSRDVPLVRAIKRDNTARKVSEESTKVNTLRDVPLVRAQETIQRDKTASKVSESTKVNTLRNVALVRAQETIQRDNNIANKMSESTKVDTLRDVPLVRAIQRDNEAKKVSEESTKTNTLRNVPLVRAQETIQGDYKARKVSEESTKVNTLTDVPLVRAQDTIRRDNIAKKMSESTKVNTLRNVRAKEVIQRDNKARKVSESTTKVDTLRDVPLVRAQETTTQRDIKAKKMSESKATGTSRAVTEPKDVAETVPVTQSNKGVPVGSRKKSVADKDYMSYLTWLVDSLKDSTTVPGPTPTMASEKDIESCSDDDDDMIMVSDSPFSCGGSTPFVVSKSKTVIDLEKDITEEDESRNCLFTKELMDLLEKPYDKRELLRLSGDVSEKKGVSRYRELRKGRVRNYETPDLGPSYLEKVFDFDQEYRRVDGDDKARLKLLRGFFFYLKNVTRAGSFKPWLPENQKKLGGLRKQCLQP
ncbi:uncharacterized protein LOC108835943 [Raphanus sativus]|uniref:Uncharacterized protein LOC108835943 n=1 Tax=Raphanus sativus TaxID=3726 RepID=A0A6J0LX77_RAPSA|nr:uncharacterized protein LOC108835943 [Raphanus sativus]